jgi:hypothetical protein
MKAPISEILLAGPRGFCAGVERAIDIVELALSVCRPSTVRREIVHNRLSSRRSVTGDLRRRVDEVPDDATVIFSAHGISPEVREEGATRSARDRRDVSARDEGPPEAAPLRARGLLDRADWSQDHDEDRYARRSA